MGDKSPKSKQKNKVQKQSNQNSEAKRKSDLNASKNISDILKSPKKAAKKKK